MSLAVDDDLFAKNNQSKVQGDSERLMPMLKIFKIRDSTDWRCRGLYRYGNSCAGVIRKTHHWFERGHPAVTFVKRKVGCCRRLLSLESSSTHTTKSDGSQAKGVKRAPTARLCVDDWMRAAALRPTNHGVSDHVPHNRPILWRAHRPSGNAD